MHQVNSIVKIVQVHCKLGLCLFTLEICVFRMYHKYIFDRETPKKSLEIYGSVLF